MVSEEQIRDDVMKRAREWAASKEPHECRNENCGAVNNYQLGKVGRVNTVQYSREKGAEKDPNPSINFAVPLVCGQCESHIKFYEE
jgi:hypothetical protein